ncbi:MAG: tetratricopeptide repeat protein [Hyphomicrobiaceae bacterium]
MSTGLSGLVIVAAIGGLLIASHAEARGRSSFTSSNGALEQGYSAYKNGNYALAEQALGYASEHGSLLGKYYLSRIYSGTDTSFVNHARAYKLLYEIVKDNAARIDVDDDPMALYVGKSLTALGLYWLHGLPELGIQSTPQRAASYFQEAATFFLDHDAQFELAKLYWAGKGVREDKRQAVHWFWSLSQRGHAGAQAFLADLHWRGDYLPRDPITALALITVATENAPASERVWIEAIYQKIYCGMSERQRQQAETAIVKFRKRFAPPPGTAPVENRDLRTSPSLTCADGLPLPIPRYPPRRRSDDRQAIMQSMPLGEGYSSNLLDGKGLLDVRERR